MTSRFVPSTYAEVYRDNAGLGASGTFEGYDDSSLSNVPLYVKLPAHLVQNNKIVYDPVSGRKSIVESWTGRLRPGTDVQESDRIKDTRTGNWFMVDSVISPPLVTGAADVKLTLTRVPR